MATFIGTELLSLATADEKRLYARYLVENAPYDVWLEEMVPNYAYAPLAPHHHTYWRHVWSIRPDARPAPFVAIWPRGGAKSTSTEIAVVALGARRARRYCLYVCASQDQADDHVSNIGSILESERIGAVYPELSDRAVSKYGAVLGWRRNRLRTASGFIVDALGLDGAARGVKLDEQRPDLIVIDDVDRENDTFQGTNKKLRTLTHGLLPAGSSGRGGLAVLAIQNLVHSDSVFTRLADPQPEFLSDRILSGPIPAISDLVLSEDRRNIISGIPTWTGQDLARCQEMLSEMGVTAFMTECQQDVTTPINGMFSHVQYRRCKLSEVPELIKTEVWVDPTVSETNRSDNCGLAVAGIDEDGTIYYLDVWEGLTSPTEALRMAIEWAIKWKAQVVGVETDNGGDTWKSVYREACTQVPELKVPPKFKAKKATAGFATKAERVSHIVPDYDHGRIVHVLGPHHVLERSLSRFPLRKPFDLVDAAYWAWRSLRPDTSKRMRIR